MSKRNIVNVDFPDSLFEQLKSAAEKLNCPMSCIVRWAVTDYILFVSDHLEAARRLRNIRESYETEVPANEK